MKIYRKTIEPLQRFKAPLNITVGFQFHRAQFSIWYSSGDEHNTNYILVPTGIECGIGTLINSVVMDDGFTVFHLLELANES